LYPVTGKCPHCGSDLVVTGLLCRSCGSSMEGQFALGRFDRLTPEQLLFVETFVRCEGKITRVEAELGVSYPTVRNRLTEAIRALGYECSEEERLPRKDRKSVLEELSRGDITAEDAIELLGGV